MPFPDAGASAVVESGGRCPGGLSVFNIKGRSGTPTAPHSSFTPQFLLKKEPIIIPNTFQMDGTFYLVDHSLSFRL